jgi:hypothetical protein
MLSLLFVSACFALLLSICQAEQPLVLVKDWAKAPTQVAMYVREPTNLKKGAPIVVLVRLAPDRV